MNKVDITISRKLNVISYDISGVRIDLFQGATICVVFTCSDGEKIYKEVVLKGDEYMLWGDDDDYIIKYIGDNIYSILGE